MTTKYKFVVGLYFSFQYFKFISGHNLYSVVTCRHIVISYAASAPLNVTNIAVKKVNDVEVIRFGAEL